MSLPALHQFVQYLFLMQVRKRLAPSDRQLFRNTTTSLFLGTRGYEAGPYKPHLNLPTYILNHQF